MKCGEFFYFIEFSLRIWKNGRIFAASEQSFLLSWLYLMFLLEHWLVKVGVFLFVCESFCIFALRIRLKRLFSWYYDLYLKWL